MKHGSLFSGIGGFDLAAERMGWENVFHCELDDWRRSFLEQKFKDSKSFKDVKTVDFTQFEGQIDVLTGGFPCQDISNAKTNEKPKGIDGAKSGLVFHMLRAIAEIKPKCIIAENVSNILKINDGRDFGIILHELARMGYNAEWKVLYASDEGAPHKRARCYLVAYTNSFGKKSSESLFANVGKEIEPKSRRFIGATISAWGEWDNEPPIPSLDDGVPPKLVTKQIESYGNAIVPQLAFQIYKSIEQTFFIH